MLRPFFAGRLVDSLMALMVLSLFCAMGMVASAEYAVVVVSGRVKARKTIEKMRMTVPSYTTFTIMRSVHSICLRAEGLGWSMVWLEGKSVSGKRGLVALPGGDGALSTA